MQALGGEWRYVKDLSEGKPIEQHGPPMSMAFGFCFEEGAVIMIRGAGVIVGSGLGGSASEQGDEGEHEASKRGSYPHNTPGTSRARSANAAIQAGLRANTASSVRIRCSSTNPLSAVRNSADIQAVCTSGSARSSRITTR